MCSLGTGRSQENDLENAKRGIGKKASSCPSKTGGGLSYGFHASMDVRLDAHSDRPDRVGHRESAMHDRAILITPLGEQLPRPCHKPLKLLLSRLRTFCRVVFSRVFELSHPERDYVG